MEVHLIFQPIMHEDFPGPAPLLFYRTYFKFATPSGILDDLALLPDPYIDMFLLR